MDSLPAFCLLADGAEEHAASAANFDLPGFGREGYHADGIGASGVDDFYSLETVNSAGIGGKDPERLQAIGIAEVATAGHAGSRSNLHQYPASQQSLPYFFIVLVGDFTASAVDIVAADLDGVHPCGGRTEAGRYVWNLRERDLHAGGESAQVDGDGKFLMVNFKFGESEGDGGAGASRSRLDGGDRAAYGGSFGNCFSIR